jgi:hypothetical protein
LTAASPDRAGGRSLVQDIVNRDECFCTWNVTTALPGEPQAVVSSTISLDRKRRSTRSSSPRRRKAGLFTLAAGEVRCCTWIGACSKSLEPLTEERVLAYLRELAGPADAPLEARR